MIFHIAYSLAFVVFLVVVVFLSRQARRRGVGARTSFIGAIYELQNQDKQRALDVIVKGKAAERRPEYPNGDLPQLKFPRKGKG